MDRAVEVASVCEQDPPMENSTREQLQQAYVAESAEAAQRLQFSVGFAQSGLQALTLVNGGALVALFTFVGAAGSVKFSMTDMWMAFASFAFGLVCNIIAYLGAHLSQDRFYIVSQHVAWNTHDTLAGREPRHEFLPSFKWGTIFQIAAIFSAITSLAAFIAGAAFALSGVSPT